MTWREQIRLTSTMPFRVHALKLDFLSDADQFAQGSDGQCGLPQEDLQFASLEVVDFVGGSKKPIGDVGLLVHSGTIRLRRAANKLVGALALPLKFIGLLAFLYGFGGWLVLPPSYLMGLL